MEKHRLSIPLIPMATWTLCSLCYCIWILWNYDADIVVVTIGCVLIKLCCIVSIFLGLKITDTKDS